MALDDIKDAPKDVQDAHAYCAACAEIGMSPPRDLVEFLQKWAGKQQAQNRYGK